MLWTTPISLHNGEPFQGTSFGESGSSLDEEVISLSYKIIYIIDMPCIFTGS